MEVVKGTEPRWNAEGLLILPGWLAQEMVLALLL